MTDSEKLIKLAEWYDLRMPGVGDEVQQDLRRIAHEIGELYIARLAVIEDDRKIKELQSKLSSKEQECEELKALSDDFRDSVFHLNCTVLSKDGELSSLRAENSQLKSDLYHAQSNLEIAGKRCEDLEAEMNKVLRTDQAWTLIDIVKKLASGTDILLHQKNYDALGWEEYEHSLTRAKDWIKLHDEILMKLLSQ